MATPQAEFKLVELCSAMQRAKQQDWSKPSESWSKLCACNLLDSLALIDCVTACKEHAAIAATNAVVLAIKPSLQYQVAVQAGSTALLWYL